MSLTADDFGEFFRDVHGVRPFPWQIDLARRVVAEGSWPHLVDVPTGLGKTALIDIGVFLAALSAGDPSPDRVGRRRIFFVVDRRIVVDQAHERALTVAMALTDPASEVLVEVARRLRSLGEEEGEDTALRVVRMRGGVTWDSAWLRRPDLPGVVTGTVDQVGSRFLFRGYGVSPRRWSIDAALVGSDSVVMVDEAHLATAMTQTLADASQFDRSTNATGLPSATVVQLSATSAARAPWVFEFDAEPHLVPDEPVAALRLRAAKALRPAMSTKSSIARDLAKAAVDQAGSAGARVLVVCNTIDRARAVHAHVQKLLPQETRRFLLIGRSRPIDREAVVEEILEWFGAGRTAISSGSAVLVATQTVEVGVDLDATGLVTECASWDALVQRIGRVNRRGAMDTTAAVVVMHDGDTNAPIYGEARQRTWEFLTAHVEEPDRVTIDVSPLGCRALRPSVPDEAFMSPKVTPVLLPVHLDAWSRTAPAPANDAPLDAYLHGIDGGVAPVSLVWREGLSAGARLGDQETTSVIDLIPIRSAESIDVPLSAVRRWLIGERAQPLGERDDDEDDWALFDDEPEQKVVRRVTSPDGRVAWSWARARELRPGDQLVVPSEHGGLDEFGWAPESSAPVRDVSEMVALEAGHAVLRLDAGLPSRMSLEAPDEWEREQVASLQRLDDPEVFAERARQVADSIRRWLGSAPALSASHWDRFDRRSRLIDALANAPAEIAISGDEDTPGPTRHQRLEPAILLLRTQTTSQARWRDSRDDAIDGTAHSGGRVSLRAHLEDVADRADEIAIRLGLPDDLRRVVHDAARWHDIGKVDPRFQAMLFGGDPVRAAMSDRPLAKSGMPPGDMRLHGEARRRSGIPPGARHEAWSLELVEEHLRDLGSYEGDRELLLHLVASHHGHARPLLPPVVDTGDHHLEATIDGKFTIAALPRRVDVESAARFAVLNQRYGRWGLALLEAVVRCADMTISGEGR